MKKQTLGLPIITALLCPICLLFPLSRVYAETEEIKGFSKATARQKTPVWCWAAAMQMVFNYGGVDWTQEDVVNSVKNRLAFETATPEEIYRGLNGWKFQHNAERWTVGCIYMKGMPVPSMIVRNLDIQRPIIVGVNGHHVVVLFKADFRRSTTQEPQITSVTVYDPWDGKEKMMPWPAAELSDVWYVWVALAKDRTFGPGG